MNEEKEAQAQINRITKLLIKEIGNVPFCCAIAYESIDTENYKGQNVPIDKTLIVSNMKANETPFRVFRDVLSSTKYALDKYYFIHFNPVLKDKKDIPKQEKPHEESMYG